MKRVAISIGAGLLALITDLAVAQPVEEVTVQASRVVNTKVVGRTNIGVPVRDVSISYRVSLEGLDLASTAGFSELEKRVKDMAEAGCKELGRLYPDATPSDAECIKRSTDNAMTSVREILAAAQKPATN